MTATRGKDSSPETRVAADRKPNSRTSLAGQVAELAEIVNKLAAWEVITQAFFDTGYEAGRKSILYAAGAPRSAPPKPKRASCHLTVVR
jgi:hypothetical protein